MTRRRKLLYTALTLGAVALMIEGSARMVWWLLERRSLDYSIRGRQILSNDAINFMKTADATYGYRLKANFKMPQLTINSEGFHQREEIPTTKLAGTLRIACLGESTTFGTNDDSNYPSFLRQLLRQHASGYAAYDVINAGVPGWVSDQIAARVRNQVAAFKPDVVILYVGWNDFQGFDPTDAPPKMSAFEAMYGGAIWKQYATSTLRSVALLSAVYQRVRERQPAASGSVKSRHAPPEVQYRFLLGNLKDIVQEFRRRNPHVQVFVCTLVGLWPQGDNKRWEEIKATVPWWITADKLTPPDAARYVAELNGALKDFARTRNLSLIDLAAAFENLDRQRLQFDWAHMYPDGYELMAWNMLSALYHAGVVHSGPDSRFQQLVSAYELPAAAHGGGVNQQ